MTHLEHDDPEISELIRREAERIETTIDLVRYAIRYGIIEA